MSRTYKMDDSTFEHLTAWCERETHNEDEMLELRSAMLTHLESIDVEDADYSISHGWQHVRDLIEGSR